MKILGIIPARYASTRFPGKPLVQINGKSMIQRVYEQVLKATSVSEVVIATDDQRIADEAERFGGRYVLTGEHQSGTDRCAEVAYGISGYDAIINIQGDEPFIDPSQINLLASCFNERDVEIATLVKEIHTETELFNANIPKVVLDDQQRAIYFSRQTIPYIRNQENSNWLTAHRYFKHIGIYGYTHKALMEVTKLAPTTLELAENLEQLRWVEHGYKIQTRITDIETIAIDTPADLLQIEKGL
jgi:3-deoxy-manno-octulosonate cytidylyltransferase (CMP-KDO synthetase)